MKNRDLDEITLEQKVDAIADLLGIEFERVGWDWRASYKT